MVESSPYGEEVKFNRRASYNEPSSQQTEDRRASFMSLPSSDSYEVEFLEFDPFEINLLDNNDGKSNLRASSVISMNVFPQANPSSKCNEKEPMELLDLEEELECCICCRTPNEFC